MRDVNQLAQAIVNEATGKSSQKEKNPAAVEMGRLGGLKGGPARAAKLSEKARKEIAKNAAAVRWGKKNMAIKSRKIRREIVEQVLRQLLDEAIEEIKCMEERNAELRIVIRTLKELLAVADTEPQAQRSLQDEK